MTGVQTCALPIFLTGREEIERCLQYLSEAIPQKVYEPLSPSAANAPHSLPRHSLGLSPLPLYSGLGTAEQLQVFAPAQPGSRKVIIATNIAEVGQKRPLCWFLT